jgi:hypothetical protein
MKSKTMAKKYLVLLLPQAFGIANALFPTQAGIKFHADTRCECRAVWDNITLALPDDELGTGCVQLSRLKTANASGVAIVNPNPCMIGIFKDYNCINIAAYAMHWRGEPSCFPLDGSPDGYYYAKMSCSTHMPLVNVTAS